MKVFINEFFENGLKAYLNQKEYETNPENHYFEYKVVDVLVKIFGEINLFNPYKTDNYRSLKENLKVYGLETKDVNSFFEYLDKFNEWKKSTDHSKNTYINEINIILIKMIILKNFYKKISLEELKFYDEYFNLDNEHLNIIVNLSTIDYENVLTFWNIKKNAYLIDKNINFEEINPSLLTNTMYERHGITMEDVKKLSNIKVDEVNEIILTEKENNKKRKGYFKPLKLSFSSGNGFVDTIVLLSIMLTEIMIGFIVALTIARM